MMPFLESVKEWVNPEWVQHRSVPRMETGLRTNVRLDAATEVVAPGRLVPDDVAVVSGRTVVSSGESIYRLTSDEPCEIARCTADITAITPDGQGLLAAVEGVGLVTIDLDSGNIEVFSGDPLIVRGVTALVVLPTGEALATIGATRESIRGDWARALIAEDRSGRLVCIGREGVARVEADGLAWPAGVAITRDGEVLLSISLEHRLEVRPMQRLGLPGRPVVANLPVYPGRIVASGSGHWVAAPRPRNRVTEMLLDEPALIGEMEATIDVDQWFVPRLRSASLFTDAMQMGQLRVLGQVKSWAPARSAGAVFRLDQDGRVSESAHARVDSGRHGVTGVAVDSDSVVVALRGQGSVLRFDTAKKEVLQ